jgi:hypothetical protein
MVYLKSFLVGIGGAIVAALLWIVVAFLLPLYWPMLVDRYFLNRGGFGAASISSGSVLLAALIGFIAAAWWGLHRFNVAR